MNKNLNSIIFGGLIVLFVLAQAFFAWGNLQGNPEGWSPAQAIGITALNFLILSIPLGLLFGAIALLLAAWQQRRDEGHVHPRLARWLYWAPRVAGILLIIFISLFSLDVFDGNATLGEMLFGFVLHMLPSIGLILILMLAWKREWIGFWVFLAAAIFFLLFVVRGGMYAFGNLLLFVLPLLLIALLFRANWVWREDIHPTLTT
jgi:hypothetical protein